MKFQEGDIVYYHGNTGLYMHGIETNSDYIEPGDTFKILEVGNIHYPDSKVYKVMRLNRSNIIGICAEIFLTLRKKSVVKSKHPTWF